MGSGGYYLTEDQVDELLAIKEATGRCPFAGAESIDPCPVCGQPGEDFHA